MRGVTKAVVEGGCQPAGGEVQSPNPTVVPGQIGRRVLRRGVAPIQHDKKFEFGVGLGEDAAGGDWKADGVGRNREND